MKRRTLTWVQSERRELLYHVVVMGAEYLRRLFAEYVDYYHEDHGHLSLDKDAPDPRGATPRPEKRPNRMMANHTVLTYYGVLQLQRRRRSGARVTIEQSP